MSKLEFIITLIKLIKPEFYNKITWTIVISGLALIGTPFWEEIISAIVKEEFNLNLAPGGNPRWGLALITLGLVYHFSTNTLVKFIEFKQQDLVNNQTKKHDAGVFTASQEIWPENYRRNFFDVLLVDHSYCSFDVVKPREYIDFLVSPENQYVDNDLQKEALDVSSNLAELLDWMSSNFWVFPENQTPGEDGLRLCMRPHWNIDRGSFGEPEHMKNYDEVTDKLIDLSSNFQNSYRTYRLNVKNKLFI